MEKQGCDASTKTPKKEVEGEQKKEGRENKEERKTASVDADRSNVALGP